MLIKTLICSLISLVAHGAVVASLVYIDRRYGFEDPTTQLGLVITLLQLGYSLFHIFIITYDDSRTNDPVVENVPTFCIELGILGTFLGFALIFEDGINLQDKNDIQSIMLALGTSITGLLTAMGFRVYYDCRYQTPHDPVSSYLRRVGLLQSLDTLKGNIYELTENLQIMQGQTNTLNLQRALTDLQARVTEFTLPEVAISGDKIDMSEMQDSINNATLSFTEASTQLNSIGAEITKLRAAIKSATSVFSRTADKENS